VVFKRLALSAVFAGLAGLGFAYLTGVMKDEPGWRAGRVEPKFGVDFWLTFIAVFAVSYLALWWHRDDA
jgi:hypothetical protein